MIPPKTYAEQFKEEYDRVHRTKELHSINSFFETLSFSVDNPDWVRHRLLFFLGFAGIEAKKGQSQVEFFFVPALSKNEDITKVTKKDLTAMYLYLKHEGFVFDREFDIFGMYVPISDEPIYQFHCYISWA